MGNWLDVDTSKLHRTYRAEEICNRIALRLTLMMKFAELEAGEFIIAAIKLEASVRYCNNHIVEAKPQTY